MTAGPIPEVRTVAYVGAGTMGCVNSLVAAVSGYEVILHDASDEMLASVRERQAGIGDFMVGMGYCTAGELALGFERVATAADLAEALAGADLVSESIYEDREAKRSLFARADELAPPDTILTTNTSALLVSDLEDAVQRGDRFAALHSHLGAPLYDIVGGPRTTAWTIDVLRRFVESLGGTPMVLRKEHPGYVFNSMNGQVMLAAVRLVLDDHATVEQVDRAWMADRSAPMGPFGMMDLFGLDLMRDSWSRPSNDAFREVWRGRIEPFIAAYVDRGRLGQKSGAGFYEYPEPAYQRPEFAAAEPGSEVASKTLAGVLVAAAVAIEADDVADRADVDRAWTAATGQATGPFGILGDLGVARFLSILDDLVSNQLVSPETSQVVRSHLTTTD